MSKDLTKKLGGTTKPLTDSQKIDSIMRSLEVIQSAMESGFAETNANLRKQRHSLDALNQSVLALQGDQRETFERLAALEQKAS